MATAKNVEQTVIAIIAEQGLMEPEDVKVEDTLETLGLDSMALVECIFGIEEAFDIQVPFNANDPQDNTFNISSVGAMIQAVEALIKDQS